MLIPIANPNVQMWSKSLGRSIVPLFTKRRRLDTCIGTGFFLRDAGVNYLVTAAHVLDKVEGGFPLFYFINHTTGIYVEGLFRKSRIPPNGTRNDDIYDIGIVQIDSQQPPYEGFGEGFGIEAL